MDQLCAASPRPGPPSDWCVCVCGYFSQSPGQKSPWSGAGRCRGCLHTPGLRHHPVWALAKSVLERADLLKHSGGQRGWHAGKLWVPWVTWGRGPAASRPRRAVERGRSTGRSTMCRVRGSGVSKSRGWMCVYVGPVEGNGAASSFIPGGGLTWGWDGLEAWG